MLEKKCSLESYGANINKKRGGEGRTELLERTGKNKRVFVIVKMIAASWNALLPLCLVDNTLRPSWQACFVSRQEVSYRLPSHCSADIVQRDVPLKRNNMSRLGMWTGGDSDEKTTPPWLTFRHEISQIPRKMLNVAAFPFRSFSFFSFPFLSFPFFFFLKSQ